MYRVEWSSRDAAGEMRRHAGQPMGFPDAQGLMAVLRCAGDAREVAIVPVETFDAEEAA